MLLFLGGSNFCLLSALSGGVMSCLSVPSATASAPVSHCPHHPAPVRGKSDAGAKPMSPCCVTLAPVAAPQIGKADPAPALFTPDVVADATPDPFPVVRAARAAAESPPPLPDLAALHAGRAPPLS